LQRLLACPRCRGRLRLASGEPPAGPSGAGEVEEGALACASCGTGYALLGGIPRLLPGTAAPPAAGATRRAFERQWRHARGLRRIFGKDAAAMRANLVNERMGSRIRAGWYAGRRVLDAGCGHGRYLAAFASLGATAVGVDVGDAVDDALAASRAAVADSTPGTGRVLGVVQGDVLSLPFRDASFDLAFSDGVIHHTTDPRRAFLELARVTAPGGATYVWVYPREGRGREAFFGAARALTTRLPGPVVRGASFAAAPLTAFVRSYSGTRFPSATWSECAQVVHDWIAPPLQSHHDWEEVAGWAREAGLVDLERLPVATGLVGWKPAS
jgi:SAM-dependent methyltransferase